MVLLAVAVLDRGFPTVTLKVYSLFGMVRFSRLYGILKIPVD
jgi:hypothetical protein